MIPNQTYWNEKCATPDNGPDDLFSFLQFFSEENCFFFFVVAMSCSRTSKSKEKTIFAVRLVIDSGGTGNFQPDVISYLNTNRE